MPKSRLKITLSGFGCIEKISISLASVSDFPIGIGQPLSMLLKLNPAVTKLNLFDIVHTPGVAADLSHCETKSDSTGFVGQEQLKGLDTEQFFLSLFCNHQEPMI